MSDDPAVQSVRVAVALCERFAELLKGPSTVSARKYSGALFGVAGNQDEMSLRIGEVQQLYPEIWRHLDDARAAFAGRGIDVSAFDQIRATEGIALGAAVDVKHARHGAGSHTMDETVKSANFNREGHARACRAYTALMRANPQIDWAGIARAEVADPAIAAFNRSTRMKRWIRLGLLVAVIAAPFAYVGRTCQQREDRIAARDEAYREARQPVAKMSDDERAESDQEIARARQLVGDARRAWPGAVTREALAAAVPTAAPCEHPFSAPTDAAADSFIQTGRAGYGLEWGNFASFHAGDVIGDGALAEAAATVERIASNVERGYGVRDDLRPLQHLPSHVVFLVIDREVEPDIDSRSGSAYAPGEVVGHGYVYSVARKQIVCAGTVEVRNSPERLTGARVGKAKRMLMRELEVRIRQALAAGLHAI